MSLPIFVLLLQKGNKHYYFIDQNDLTSWRAGLTEESNFIYKEILDCEYIY